MRLFPFAAAAAFTVAAFAQPADMVLRNGKIVTMNAATPVAQAIAVRGEKITAVGSDAQSRQWIGPNTNVIDLHGMLAIPGFIEGHGHFTGVGEFRMGLDLREARTWAEIVDQVGRAVRQAQPGEWIIGRGWHQSKWSKAPEPNVEGFPTHASLDAVSPNNPVLLTHASGHASFVNGAAMKAAGITRDTKDPQGGEVLRDAKGDPTGLLRERASGLVTRARNEADARRTPAQVAARQQQAIKLAVDEALSKGITTFQDAGSPFSTVDTLKRMADNRELRMRIWMMLRASNSELAAKLPQYKLLGYGNDYLTVRGIKRAIDGALGPRGAWLLEPYNDKPDSSGLNTDDPADIRNTADLAIQHGFQLCVHAIGDRANRETLNIFEDAFKANPDRKDLR